MRGRRDATCTICRVTAMLMIVLCHSIKFFEFLPGHKQMAPLLAFGVEIFLLISGFLYSCKKPVSYLKWFEKSYFKLQVPILLWVSLWCIIFLIVKTPITLLQYISYIFNYQGLGWIYEGLTPQQLPGMSHLWFPTIIFICYLLLPILKKIRPFFLQHTVLSVIILSVISVILSLFGIRFAYFYIFILGYIIGLKRHETEKSLLFKPVTGILLSSTWLVFWIAVFLIGNKFFHESNFYIYTCWLHLACAFSLWFFTVVSVISAKHSEMVNKISGLKVVKWFEKYSYYIYITHCTILLSDYNFFKILDNTLLAILLYLVYTVVTAIILKALSDPILKFIYKKTDNKKIKPAKEKYK